MFYQEFERNRQEFVKYLEKLREHIFSLIEKHNVITRGLRKDIK